VPARATRRRPIVLAAVAAFIAGVPTLLLALTWLAVARSVAYPEATCWIADADSHFLLAGEAALVAGFFGFLPRILLSFLVLLGLRVVSTFGARFVVVNLTVATFSWALIILGQSTASGIESRAYSAYATNCKPAVKSH